MKLPFTLLLSIFIFGTSLHAQIESTATLFIKKVTAADYVIFLNAVAARDSDYLYDKPISSDPNTGCIARTGTSGSYCYFAIAGRENDPVSFVTEYAQEAYYSWLGITQAIADNQESTTYYLGSNKNNFSIEEETSMPPLTIAPLHVNGSSYASNWTASEQRAAGAMLIGLLAVGSHIGYEHYAPSKYPFENTSFSSERALETQEGFLDRVQRRDISHVNLDSSLENRSERETAIRLAMEADDIGGKLYEKDLRMTPALANKLGSLTKSIKELAAKKHDERPVTEAKKALDEHFKAIEDLIEALEGKTKSSLETRMTLIKEHWSEFSVAEAESAEAAIVKIQKVIKQLEKKGRIAAAESTRLSNADSTDPKKKTKLKVLLPEKDTIKAAELKKNKILSSLCSIQNRITAALPDSQTIHEYKSIEASMMKTHQGLSDLSREIERSSVNKLDKDQLLLVLTKLQETLPIFLPEITTPHQFLEKLLDERIDKSFSSYQIRALNGKIILQKSEQFHAEDQTTVDTDDNEPLNLIRLAIQDSCGTEARRTFDYHFRGSLTVDSLKQFLLKDKETFSRKQFIDVSKLPASLDGLHSQLQDISRHRGESKTIALSDEGERFNPFLTDLNNSFVDHSIYLGDMTYVDAFTMHHDHNDVEDEDVPFSSRISPISHDDDDDSKPSVKHLKASTGPHPSIAAAREILQKITPEDTELLKRFDEAFKDKSSATVQNFSNFIAQEIERKNQEIAEQNRFTNKIYAFVKKNQLSISFIGGMASTTGGKFVLFLFGLIAAHEATTSSATTTP